MFGQDMGKGERNALAEDDGRLYDVVEVSLDTRTVRLMTDTPKTARNADAIERIALMRRGNDSNFFATVPAGTYADGDAWTP